MEKYEVIIQRYLDAYNVFDVKRMLADMHENVRFENIDQGISTMVLQGLAAFEIQAANAKGYFSERKQSITNIKHLGEKVEVGIKYEATLAIDFPNGMKRGEQLRVLGKSTFIFKENKIIGLIDEN